MHCVFHNSLYIRSGMCHRDFNKAVTLFYYYREKGWGKMNYLQRLNDAMLAAGIYDTSYIQICLSYAEKLLHQNLPVLFDEKHVNMVLCMEDLEFPCYTSFYIRGKRKSREITAPSMRLKTRQRWILDEILEKIPVSEYCHGFVTGKSIVTNAKAHMGKEQILVMDIQNFFPSIKKQQVINIFNNIGYSVSASKRLGDICCFNGELPQGAPTSPYLANLRCRKMDVRLGDMAAGYGLIYTRYADDMTFSGDVDLDFLIPLVENELARNGFVSNGEKTRIYRETDRKMVTGLVVKENRLRVPKQFKRKLKQEIYYCKKLGVSTHLQNTSGSRCVNFREYLYGKAYYIKMVEPETGENFLK